MSASRVLLMALALGLSASLAAQDFDAARYKTSSLGDIIEKSKKTQHLEPLEADIVAGEASYRVDLEWTGNRRPIDPATLGFLTMWLRTLGLPDDHAALFQEELCFKEGSAEYWLPVQATLVKDITAELKAGSRLRLYVVWMGSVGNERFFFIVNGYDDL